MVITMSFVIILLATIQWIIIRRIPSRFVRIFLQVPLLIVTFFAAWFFAAYRADVRAEATRAEEAQQIFDTTTVQRGDFLVTVDATGAITPTRQIPLVFGLSSAPVEEVMVEVGERVESGTVLAVLDDANFEQALLDAGTARELQQLTLDTLLAPPREVDIASAEAALAVAEAQLSASFATGPTAIDRQIARLQEEVARNQRWQAQLARDSVSAPAPIDLGIDADFDLDIVEQIEGTIANLNAQQQAAFEAQLRASEQVVLQAETGVDVARANLESTLNRGADPAALAGANAGIEAAQRALDRLRNGPTEIELARASLNVRQAELAVQQAEQTVVETELVAPFDGLVAQLNLQVGELPPQGVAALLVDDSSYIVDLPIDETDIAQVQRGQRVDFQVDALPSAEVRGVVESIAYTPLGIDQVVVYNVRVRIAESSAQLRPGLTVTGRIRVTERSDVLLIRNEFVRVNPGAGDALVTVQNRDGTLQQRLVLLGQRGDTFSEIRGGLEAGERVVLVAREGV